MVRHTKRSPKFKKEIDKLVRALRSMRADDVSYYFDQIADVLLFNTTDSACIVKAADDEPIFTLRGRDVHAPYVVLKWIESMLDEEANQQDPVKRAKLKQKLDDARECMQEMLEYPNRRAPD